MVKRTRSIALGALFLWVPLAFYARAADGFTLTKELTAVLAVVFLIFLPVLEGDFRFFKPALVKWSVFFFLWMLVDSLVVGLLKEEVLKGSVHLFLLTGTLLAVLYVCDKGHSYARLIHYALAAGTFMAAYGLLQALGLDKFNWNVRFENRAFATLGNPDYLGGHLVGLIPLAFVMTLQSTTRLGWLGLRAATLILFAGLLATRVRGAGLSLAGALAFIAIAFCVPWGRELFRRNARFILVALGIVGAMGGAYLFRHGGFRAFDASQASVQQRLEIYKTAWEMLKDHPFSGIGLGQVGVQYPRYQFRPYTPPEYPAHPYVYTEHIHNEFLQFGAEGGIPGLLLFLGTLAAFGVAVRRFMLNPESKPENKELLIGVSAGLFALLLQSLSNFPLRIAPSTVLFGLLLAAPLALRAPAAERAPLSLSPLRKAVLVVALLAVLGVGLRTVAASIAYRNTLGETSLGQGANAVVYGTRLVALSPWNPKAWTAYAKALELTGQADQALTVYQRAQDLNPNAVENWTAMANIHFRKGMFEEAVEECRKASVLTPNYPGVFWTEATALYQLKRYGEAAQLFENLGNYFPRNPQVLANLGVCYIQMGRKAEAVEAWKKAHALNPGDSQVIQYLKANGVSL